MNPLPNHRTEVPKKTLYRKVQDWVIDMARGEREDRETKATRK